MNSMPHSLTSKHFMRWSSLAAAALVAASPVARGAAVVKADNGDALNLTTSWVGGVVPGASDLALFDNTITANRTVAAGADQSWLGLQVSTQLPASLFTISGNTITLGTSGIDMMNSSMSVTIASAVALGASQTWNASSNTTALLTVSGVISGANGLTKTGNGAITLAGANTFTGGLTLSQGILNLNNAGALGTGLFTVNNGVTLDNTSAAAVTLSPQASGQVWNGSFTYAGTAAANLSLSLGTRAVTMTNNVTIAVSNANTSLTVAGVISGAGFGIVKTGNGGLVLSGNSSSGYNGGVTVDAGVLHVNQAGALGTGVLTLNGGNLNNSSGAALTVATANAQTWGADFTFIGTNSLGLGAGAVSLTGNRVVTVSASTLTVAGNIAGAGFGITKAGAGTLVLAGANTFDGGVTLNGGQLNLNSGGALGTGTFTIGPSGGILGNSSGNATTIATNNPQVWDGDFSFAGPNSLNLGTGAVAMTGFRAITVTAANLTVGGVISGTGFSLTKLGAGTLILGGNNVFDGGVSLQAGTLALANSGALGTGSLSIFGGTLANASGANLTLANNNHVFLNANLTYAGPNDLDLGSGGVDMSTATTVSVAANSTLTIGGTLAGFGVVLTKAGNGTLVLSGNNSLAGYDGGTVLSAGTLVFANANSLPPSFVEGSIAIQGAASPTIGFGFAIDQATLNHIAPTGVGFTVALGANTSNPLNFGNYSAASLGAIANQNVTFSGALLPGSTTYRLGGGGGTLNLATNNVLSGSLNELVVTGPGVVVLPASNSYGAGTTISGGTLEFPALASLGTGSNLTINGGALRYGAGNSVDISALAVTFGSAGATIDTNSNNVTFANAIGNGGTGAFTKAGNGNLTLNSAVAYTGGTVVSGGRLILGTNEVLADAANLTIQGGAIFDLGGNNETVATVTLGNGSIVGAGTLSGNSFAVQNGVISANLSGAGGLTKTSGNGTVILSGTNTYAGATAINAGTVEFSSIMNLGANSTVSFNGGTLRWAAGSTADISSRTMVFNNGGATFDTNGNDVTLANSIGGNGAGSFTKTGAGNLTIAVPVTYTGSTTIAGGALVLGAFDVLASSSVVLNVGGGSLNFGNTTNATFGGLSGNLGLSLVNNSAQGVALTINTGSGASLTYSGDLSGTGGSLIKTGPGQLTLNGTNTYDGGTTIAAGTLVFGTPGSVAGSGRSVNASTGSTVSSGFGIDNSFLNRLVENSNAFTVALAGNSSSNLDFSSAAGANLPNASLGATSNATYTGTLTPSGGNYRLGGGTGVLTLPNTNAVTGAGSLTVVGNGVVVLGGTNDYAGGTFLNGGSLQFSSLANLGSGALSFNGGALQWAANSTTDVSTRVISFGPAGGAFDTNGNNVTIANPIGNDTAGGLEKRGGGALTLAAANTYGGGTTVSGGTLTFTTLANLGSGGITLNSGTLNWLGTEDISTRVVTAQGGNSTLSIPANVTVTFANSIGNNGTGRIVKAGAGALTLNAPNTNTGGYTLAAGTLDINHNAALGASGTFIISGGNLGSTVGTAAVPIVVPSTVPVSITAGFGLPNTGVYQFDGPVTVTGNQTITFGAAGSVIFNGTVNGGAIFRTAAPGSVIFGPGASGTIAALGTGNFSGVQQYVINGANLVVSNTGSMQGMTVNAGNISFTNGYSTLNNDGFFNLINGGNLTSTSLVINRDANNVNPSTTAGLVVNGGNATYTGSTINAIFTSIIAGSNNSSGHVNVLAGNLTANGAVIVGRNNTGGRGGAISVNGGNLVILDTVNGLVLSMVGTGGNANNVANAFFTNGTATIEKIIMGFNAAVNAGTAGLTVNGGALYIGSGGIISNGTGAFAPTITLTSGTVGAKADWSTNMAATSATTFQFKAADSSNVGHNITWNGNLVGAGGLNKTGNGVLALGANNIYSGPTVVSAGTLVVSSLGNGGNAATFSGNTVTTSTTVAVANTTGLTVGQLVYGTSIIPGTFITAVNPGNVVLSTTPQAANATNVFTYGTASSLGISNATAATVVLNGGSLRYAGAAASSIREFTIGTAGGGLEASGTGPLNLTSTAAITLAGTDTARTLRLGGSNAGNNTLAAAIVDNGTGATSLLKTGSGQWILAGNNTYTGATAVNGGVLNLASSLPSSAVTVNTGGVLTGTGVVGGGVTLNSGGALFAGATGVGNTTVSSLTVSTGAILSFGLGANGSVVNVTGLDGLVLPVLAGGNGGINLYASGTSDLWTSVGNFTLFTFNGTLGGTGVTGWDFTTVLNPFSGLDYQFSVSGNSVLLSVSAATAPNAWNVNASGNWSTTSNWGAGTTAGGPNTAGLTVSFPGVITSPQTVTLDANRTVGALEFTSTLSYTLAASGGAVLTLNNSGMPAVINSIAGTQTVSAPLSLTAAGLNVTPASGGTIVLAGPIGGTGAALTMAGNGLLVLAGASTYSGGTNFNSGTVEFTALGNLGAGGLNFNGGALRWAAGSTVDISSRPMTFASNGVLDTNGNNVTLANPFGENSAGGLTKIGNGILTLGGNNTYLGATNLNGGTVSFTILENLGGGTAINFNGGTLLWGADNIFDISQRTVTFNSNGGVFDVGANNVTLFGPIGGNGTGGLTKRGTGDLTLASGNTYSGPTSLQQGRLFITDDTSLGVAPGAVTPNHLILGDGTTFSIQTGTVSLSGNRGVAIGPGSGTGSAVIDVAEFNQLTIPGIIANNGTSSSQLVKNGAGLLVLGGANTFTGGVMLNAGALLTAANGALGTGTLVFNGGEWQVSTSGASPGAIAFLTNGTIVNASGNNQNVGGTLSASADKVLTLSNSGQITLTGNMNDFNGTVQLTNGPLRFNSADANTNTGGVNATFDFGSGGSINSRNAGTINLGAINSASATTTISGPSTGAGTATFSIGAANTPSSFAGSIVNTGATALAAITKVGNSSLTLTGANTYTGGTTISSGTLDIGGGGTTGTIGGAAGNVTILSTGTLNFNRSNTYTVGNTISGDGGVNHVGTGELVLTGNNAYTGVTSISGGGILTVNTLINAGVQLASTSTAPVVLASNTTGSFARISGTTTGNATVTLGVGNTTALFEGQTVTGGGIPANTTIIAIDNIGGTITLSANATTTSASGNLTYGANPTITVADTTGLVIGQFVSGTGIAANATIVAIDAGNNTVRLSSAATANTTANDLNFGYPAVTVSSTVGLTVGQTVAGVGMPANATIASIDSGNNTITLNVPATAGGSNNLNYFTRNPLGGSTASASSLVIDSGTFRYAGSAAASTDRLFSIGTNATLDASGANANATTSFVNPGAIGLLGVNTARTFTLSGTNTGNNTLASLLGDNGAGATTLRKTGTGTWVLPNANTYTGGTIIDGGVLKVINTSGSATGPGTVTVAGGAVLSGNGIIAGIVSAQANSTTVPGNNGVGNLTVGGLNIATGSNFTYEFALDGSTNDLIVVTGSNGLVTSPLSGGADGGFALYAANSTNPFATFGTYNLFSFNGTIGGSGVGAFTTSSILNPQFGVLYSFDTSGGFVRLIISPANTPNVWNLDADGNWGTLANWNANTTTVPDGVGVPVYFGAVISANRTVTLDGGRTVGNITFDNVNGYTLAPGTGVLTLNNGGSAAVANVVAGNHTISAPVVLTANGLAASPSANTSLNISGAISGAGGVTKTGNGVLTLSGLNTYAGSTTVSGGTLNAAILADGGLSSSIGNSSNAASNLVLNGGALSHSGAANSTTDRLATIGTAGGRFTSSGAGAVSFTNAGSLVLLGTDQARNIGFGGNGTGLGSFAPVIADNGAGLTSVTKGGSSEWTLTGNNTYTGVTTVNTGVLGVVALGSGGVPSGIGASSADAANLVLNGGTLKFNSSGSASTDRLFTVGSAGGGLSVAAGGLVTWSNTSPIAFASANSSATLTFAGEGEGTFTPVIPNNGTGNVSVVKNDSGVWTLQSANTYSGGTIFNSGILQFSSATALGAGAITFNAGTLRGLGAALTLTNTMNLTSTNPVFLVDAGNNTTYSGVLSGVGGFTKAGNGQLNLGGANTFAGGLRLEAGTLNLTVGGAAGTGGAAILNGGSILVSISEVLNGNNLVVNGNVTIFKTNATTNYNLGGTGATLTGNGTLNLSNAAGTGSLLTLNNNMTAFAGTVVFQGNGAIRFNSGGGNTNTGSPNAVWDLGATGSLTSRNPGTISLGSLTGGAGALLGAPQNSTGTLLWSVGALGTDTTYGGTIAPGNGGNTIAGLTKVGTGRLVLTNGALTHVAATTINAGTLVNNGNMTVSPTAVNAGGTAAGTGTYAAVTVNVGGRVSPAENAIGTLTATSLTWNSDDVLAGMSWTLSDLDSTSDLLHLTGNLTKGAGVVFLFDFQGTGYFTGSPTTYTLMDFVSNSGFVAEDFGYANAGPGGTYRGFFTVNAGNLQFTINAIPEPGTWALILGGVTMLLAVIRKRRAGKTGFAATESR